MPLDYSTATTGQIIPSIIGAGLGIGNQQQAYSGLQDALRTIGPTQLQGFNIGGPGGMSTGFNPMTGSGSINLGALGGGFNNLAAGGGAGAGLYNPTLLAGLTGGAASTLPASLATLGGAYGNYGAGMGAANAQLGNLGNFNSTYGSLLGAMRGQMQPQIQQQAYGLQNTLFGNGVADSTGAASGSLAAQNFGRGVGQADASAQLAAFQQALGQQQTAGNLYGTLSSSAGGILNNAFNTFGNTNQLISGLNTAQLNNSLGALQGAGALNTVGLNNYNSSMQTALAAASARNQSLFPYAMVANNLAGTQNGMGAFGSALSQIGANGGLGGMFNNLFGGGNSPGGGVSGWMNNLFGGGVSPVSSGAFGDALSGAGLGSVASNDAGFASQLSSDLSGFGFSPAGGEAATGGIVGGAPVGNSFSVAGPAMSGPGGLSPGLGAAPTVDPAAAAPGYTGLSSLALPAAALAGFAGLTGIWAHNAPYTTADMGRDISGNASSYTNMAQNLTASGNPYASDYAQMAADWQGLANDPLQQQLATLGGLNGALHPGLPLKVLPY